MTPLEVELNKLLEVATLSSADSFTKTRRPQYKPSNESAAQRGRSAEPAPALAPSIAAGGDEDWDMIRSNESTADGSGSGSGCTVTHRRPGTNATGVDAEAEAVDDSHLLTLQNVQMLNRMNNQLSVHERFMMHESQAKHSIMVRGTMTLVSENTIDLGGETYSPAGAHAPEGDIFAVGAWADPPMPPMA
ncbi:Fc.00g065610.m01.CDS01 [Cosmosporella sp. VM-42]